MESFGAIETMIRKRKNTSYFYSIKRAGKTPIVTLGNLIKYGRISIARSFAISDAVLSSTFMLPFVEKHIRIGKKLEKGGSKINLLISHLIPPQV